MTLARTAFPAASCLRASAAGRDCCHDESATRAAAVTIATRMLNATLELARARATARRARTGPSQTMTRPAAPASWIASTQTRVAAFSQARGVERSVASVNSRHQFGRSGERRLKLWLQAGFGGSWSARPSGQTNAGPSEAASSSLRTAAGGRCVRSFAHARVTVETNAGHSARTRSLLDERRNRLRRLHHEEPLGVIRLEGVTPTEHLPGNEPDRVDVCTRIHGAARCLLRGKVSWSAEQHASARTCPTRRKGDLGDPEIQDLVTSRPLVVRARNRFSGFRSRWTTPTAWAASSPAHTCQRIGTASSGGRKTSRRRRSSRLSPVSSSIAK